VIDVSFISLREILPHIATIAGPNTLILAMVKPQFEASRAQVGSSGVIKNDTVRRTILRDFEQWSRTYFMIQDKADSEVKGSRGNQERFYVLRTLVK
jgi:23S rRNA (cytidine1920-2'-O)/16S rRNA (cytidine1409-2'-O)-methyltransferase